MVQLNNEEETLDFTSRIRRSIDIQSMPDCKEATKQVNIQNKNEAEFSAVREQLLTITL